MEKCFFLLASAVSGCGLHADEDGSQTDSLLIETIESGDDAQSESWNRGADAASQPKLEV